MSTKKEYSLILRIDQLNQKNAAQRARIEELRQVVRCLGTYLDITMTHLPKTISGEKNTLLFDSCKKHTDHARSLLERLEA